MGKIKVGLYGTNGHQVHDELLNCPDAEIAAVAAFGQGIEQIDGKNIRVYDTLDQMLADGEIQLVSLCSPKRSLQAGDAIRCMEAGKHVYAEKPAALNEKELDEIIRVSCHTGMQFHEMAGTIYMQPYMEMHRLIKEGAIGEVVQVFTQKSYPYGDWRPQDEDIDGGLLMQAGIYNLRFMEHIAGVKVKAIEAFETKLGNNTENGECRRAVSMIMKLENGGVGSGIVNYLVPPPPAVPNWGYEILRVFGTEGLIESIDLGRVTRLVSRGRDCGSINLEAPSKSYLHAFIESLKYDREMPFTMEEELHPTRMVIQAKSAARL